MTTAFVSWSQINPWRSVAVCWKPSSPAWSYVLTWRIVVSKYNRISGARLSNNLVGLLLDIRRQRLWFVLFQDIQRFFLSMLAHRPSLGFLPAIVIAPFEKLQIPIFSVIRGGVFASNEIVIQADLINDIQGKSLFVDVHFFQEMLGISNDFVICSQNRFPNLA